MDARLVQSEDNNAARQVHQTRQAANPHTEINRMKAVKKISLESHPRQVRGVV